MRNYIIITLVLGIGLSSAFGIGGDMGVGTNPLIDGTESHPFLIEDITDFNNFSNDPNYWAVGVHTRLDTDIDLAGEVYERAVLAEELDEYGNNNDEYFTGFAYSGIFDGNDHVVRNLTINTNGLENDFLGLFGCIQDANTVIKNLGVEDFNIIGGNRSIYIGGLCGNNGDITFSYLYGSIKNCYSTGSISTGYQCEHTGGLCGRNIGVLSGCYSISTITMGGSSIYTGGLCGSNEEGDIIDSYSESQVTGVTSVGGLCGDNYSGKIIGCYSTSEVTGSLGVGGLCGGNTGDVNDCNSSGVVTGHENVGGFCGINRGSIVNSSSGNEVIGNENIGGFCGINTRYNIYDPEVTIINCHSTCDVSGDEYVGGFCGYNNDYDGEYGKLIISNCSSNGVVTGGIYTGGFCGYNYWGNIDKSFSHATIIIDEGSGIGGFCGYNRGSFREDELSINNCYSEGTITADINSLVCGFCGIHNGGISNSYSACEINEPGVNSYGFSGYIAMLSEGYTLNCFWDVERSGVAEKENDSYGTIGKTTDEMQTVRTFIDAGWDFYTSGVSEPNWVMSAGGYPEFSWQHSISYDVNDVVEVKRGDSCVAQVEVFSRVDEVLGWSISGEESYEAITLIDPNVGESSGPDDRETVSIYINAANLYSGYYTFDLTISADNGDAIVLPLIVNVLLAGEGTQANPYLIESLGGFDIYSDPCYADTYWASGVYTKLASDIDLTGRVYETAVIGNEDSFSDDILFEGVFDGDGYIVRNLMIDARDTYTQSGGFGDNSYLGLFGVINGTTSMVKNLGVVDVNIVGGYSSDDIGGLCGSNGFFFHPNQTAGGTILNCYTTGTIINDENFAWVIGGFCGSNNNGGTISNSYSKTGIRLSGSSSYVGGFCGANDTSIISNCYSTGELILNSGDYLGGFCGYNYDGDMNNSFWDVNSSGIVVGYNLDATYPGVVTNVVGKTTAEMYAESTFTDAGWDFVAGDGDIADWWVNEWRDYPKLYWQPYGDLNNDSRVDMLDIAVMGLSWYSSDGDVNFNSVCELSGDWVIDEADLLELGVMWLAGPDFE